jgi:hypothetical protein
MGIPYFCFQEPDALIGLWEYSNIDEILYIARTTAELQDNIKNNRVFRKSKTVDDLIFISNTNDKDEFIQMFETAVLKCIGQKEKK